MAQKLDRLETCIVWLIFIAVCAGSLYMTLDLVATKHHLWQGNVVSVTIVFWFDRLVDPLDTIVFPAIAEGMKNIAKLAVGMLVHFGLTPETAEVTAGLAAGLAYWIAAIALIVHFVRRSRRPT